MRQSRDYSEEAPLSAEILNEFLHKAVADLDVEKARTEVSPFVRSQHSLDIWSKDFFMDIIGRIVPV
jgi:hypothetical protein